MIHFTAEQEAELVRSAEATFDGCGVAGYIQHGSRRIRIDRWDAAERLARLIEQMFGSQWGERLFLVQSLGATIGRQLCPAELRAAARAVLGEKP